MTYLKVGTVSEESSLELDLFDKSTRRVVRQRFLRQRLASSRE